MPDRLEPFQRFDLPASTVRPIWLSLDIPPGTPAGVYRGTIAVGFEKGSATLRTEITVQARTLPPPSDWKLRLDLWQNPWVVAWYYHVEQRSEENKAVMRVRVRVYVETDEN